MIFDPFHRKRTKLIRAIGDNDVEVILNFVREDISWLTKPLDMNNWTLLHKIAKSGNVETLQKIINILEGLPKKLSDKKKYAIFNCKTRYGSTPLHVASSNEQIIKLLLSQRADVLLRNQYNKTPFEQALSNHHFATAPLLFNAQISLTEIVIELTKSGNAAGLAKLYELTSVNGTVPNWFEKNYLFNKESKQHGGKLVHLASAFDQSEVIDFIVSKLGTNYTVNCAYNGSTPLHFAAMFGNESAVQSLLKHGADIHKINNQRCDPLTLANYNKQDKVVDILLQNNANANSIDVASNSGPEGNILSMKKKQLVEAIQGGNLAALKQYVEGENGKPGNLAWIYVTLSWSQEGKRHKGNAISLAAASGNVEILQYIQSKLNSNTVFNNLYYGFSPLHYAARFGKESAVEFLLANNADPNLLTPNRESALTLANLNSHASVIDALLRRNLTARIIDQAENIMPRAGKENLLKNKKRDLANSIIAGNLAPLKQLVEGDGVSLGNPEWLKVNFDLKTPGQAIHIAANYGHEEIVRYLIEKGGKDIVNSRTKRGLTPLHFASFRNKEAMVKLLLENKAGINEIDEEGQSPLFYAVCNDCKHGIQLLLDNGAKLNLRNTSGETVSKIKCYEGKSNEIQDRFDLLAQAIKNNKIEVVKKFAAQNREWLTEPLTKEGLSALTLAILSGNQTLTTFILNEFKKEPMVNLNELEDFVGFNPKDYAALKDTEFFSKALFQFEVVIKNKKFNIQDFKKSLDHKLNSMNLALMDEILEFLPNPSCILNQVKLRNKITEPAQLVHFISKYPSSVPYLFEDNRLFEMLIDAVSRDKNLLKKIVVALPLSTIQKQEQKLLELLLRSASNWNRLFVSSKKQMATFLQQIAGMNSDESNLFMGHAYNFGLFGTTQNSIEAGFYYDKIILTEKNKNLYLQAKYEQAHMYCCANSQGILELNQIRNARSTFAKIIEVMGDEDISEFLNNSDLNENVDLVSVGQEMQHEYQRNIALEEEQEPLNNLQLV